MKKLFLMAVMSVVSLTAAAQFDDDFQIDDKRERSFSAGSGDVESGFRMGVQLNVGISDLVADYSSIGMSYGLGWIAEYNFTPNLFLQSGINFQNIGHKEDYYYRTISINALYVQLPIHVGYRFELGAASIFIQAGPTLGVGIWGSNIHLDYGQSISYFDAANRFDLGVGGRIGVEFSRFQISAGANYGVLDTYDFDNGNNLVANIGVAYMF
ncbi:MAG: PorT family protein [Muribaculaceae bacterium]|nr:PorT family protein [Muribaculaceae bacterium]